MEDKPVEPMGNTQHNEVNPLIHMFEHHKIKLKGSQSKSTKEGKIHEQKKKKKIRQRQTELQS